MNWTGGRLQRHSRNAAKGVVGRQKAHFAKVRTQLQNGPGEHATPFKPDYFDGCQLASFMGGNARRDSRPQTLHGRAKASARAHGEEARYYQNEKERQLDQPSATRRLTDATGPFPAGESAASASPMAAVPRSNPQNQALVCDASPSPQNKPPEHDRIAVKGKRMPANPYTAEEAWEDSKRRLLNRPDWVGLAPSRPVKMHFPLRRDKDRIGKRRKIDKHAVVQPADNDRIMHQHVFHSNTRQSSPFLNAPVVENVEDISVRIGTDALTNHTVEQRVQPAQGGRQSLSGSSDFMLFDNPAELLQPPSASADHIHKQASALVPEFQQFGRSSNIHSSDAQLQTIDNRETYHLLDTDSSPESSSAHDTASHYRDRGSTSVKHDGATATNPKEHRNSHGCDFHITQRSQDPRPPYRFVSEEPSDCSVKGVHDALQGSGMGAFDKSNTTSSAFLPWENEVRGVAGPPRGRELLGKGAPIDDDAPWEQFLAIAGDGSSSHSTTTGGWRGPGLSRQRLLDISGIEHRFSSRANSELDTLDAPPARKFSASHTKPWGGRGGHSTPSPSPLLHPDRKPDARSRNVSGNKTVDSEESWKRFVFGDSSPAFDAAAHNDCRGPGRPSTPVQDRSRKRLTSSLAVGGVSSTKSMLSLPTLSTLASPHFLCVSDDVHNARSQMKEAAPFSAKVRAAQTHNNVSPGISSSVLGNASRLDSGNGNSSMITPGEHLDGRAEQSMTHASLENNAFSTFSPFDVSSVETDESTAANPMMFHEGLDRKDEAGEKRSRPCLLKRPESLPQVASSMKGIPDSDEMDLIDPDRIE